MARTSTNNGSGYHIAKVGYGDFLHAVINPLAEGVGRALEGGAEENKKYKGYLSKVDLKKDSWNGGNWLTTHHYFNKVPGNT